MKIRFACAALAATLACAGAANAAAVASASVSSFTITLIDTNPFDGIAPSISFTDPYNMGQGSYVNANASTISGWNVESDSQWADGALGALLSPFSASVAVGQANASAQVGNDSIGLLAYAQAVGTGTYDYSQANAAFGPHWGDMQFVLSANTIMLVSASYSLYASVGDDYVDEYSFAFDSASASVFVQAYMSDGVNNQWFNASETAVAFNIPGYERTDAASGQVFGSLFNGSSESMTGRLYLYAGVAVHDSVTPVPEAETYALALAGLSVVGLAVARRRKV